MSSPQDALHQSALDYPGGVAAVAARLNKPYSTLANKLNPNITNAEPSYSEAIKVMHIVGYAALHAQNADAGLVAFPVGSFQGVSDTALLEVMTRFGTEFGDVTRELHEALKDGKITNKELQAMEQQLYELNQAGAELLNRVRQLMVAQQVKDAGAP